MAPSLNDPGLMAPSLKEPGLMASRSLASWPHGLKEPGLMASRVSVHRSPWGRSVLPQCACLSWPSWPWVRPPAPALASLGYPCRTCTATNEY